MKRASTAGNVISFMLFSSPLVEVVCEPETQYEEVRDR